ncbi:hypothetical protein OAQ99_06320 [Candidatus Kapabacteria bacterium]|nr:hypothetical protein [Candidatus Kapabacteria bacterium]
MKKLLTLFILSYVVMLSKARYDQPYLQEAWMDRAKDKVGYEINFTKYFNKLSRCIL